MLTIFVGIAGSERELLPGARERAPAAEERGSVGSLVGRDTIEIRLAPVCAGGVGNEVVSTLARRLHSADFDGVLDLVLARSIPVSV